MTKWLIKLTPLEPYFFGGERIFDMNTTDEEKNKHYYIRSLNVPSQATLFGALRYMCIKNLAKGFYLDAEDKLNIGSSSYKLNDTSNSNFGKIKGISPLYLYHRAYGFLIRTPFDHKTKDPNGNVNEFYTSFKDYSGPISTSRGERRLPKDYKAKDGLADSWLILNSNKIYANPFDSFTKIGIDRANREKSFFKKEYKQLKPGFSFAFFANLEENFEPFHNLIYLGQGKSIFRVEWSLEQEPNIPANLIRDGMLYAQSDLYYKDDIVALYNECKFVCVQTRDFRVFYTDYNKSTLVSSRFQKGKNIPLIQAGSIFWPNEQDNFIAKISDSHASIAGFNQIVSGGIH